MESKCINVYVDELFGEMVVKEYIHQMNCEKKFNIYFVLKIKLKNSKVQIFLLCHH